MPRQTVTNRQAVNLSQNLFVRSSEFDNASWIKDLTTLPIVTVDQIANPINGNVDADLFSENTLINSIHRLYQGTFTLLPGIWYTFSCYMKNNNAQYGVLSMDGVSELAAIFDLQTGTLTNSTYNTARFSEINFSIQDQATINPIHGAGWYRVWASFLVKVQTSQFLALATSATNSVSGVFHAGNNKSLYLYGAQLVRANWPGSYTPTTSAASTNPIRNIVTSRASISNRSLIS